MLILKSNTCWVLPKFVIFIDIVQEYSQQEEARHFFNSSKFSDSSRMIFEN